VVIVGDDQAELYSRATFGVRPSSVALNRDHAYDGPLPAWRKPVAEAYAMDKVHRFPAGGFRAQDCRELIDQSIDVTIATDVPDPRSSASDTPLVFRSNACSAGGRSRSCRSCSTRTFHQYSNPLLDAGDRTGTSHGHRSRADEMNVAVLASGGLSHFVVRTARPHGDRQILASPMEAPLVDSPARPSCRRLRNSHWSSPSALSRACRCGMALTSPSAHASRNRRRCRLRRVEALS